MKEIVLENGNTLAFIGDAIYSLLVREHFIRLGFHKPNILQQKSIQFVSAKAQAEILRKLIAENEFDEMELEIIHRGRNAKSDSVAKNADIIDYRMATGLEALFGYLYLYHHNERISELFDKIKKM